MQGPALPEAYGLVRRASVPAARIGPFARRDCAVSSYIYDQASQSEEQRLTRLQDVRDPISIRWLEAAGVGPGWRCLEVGAGRGSLVRWLCRRVGGGGHVVATDLDVGSLRELDEPNLVVRQHDIAHDPLEEDAFDLVHSRLVLEHLPEREHALDRMVAALRPGGTIVVEDVDFQLPIAADPAACAVFPPEAADVVARFWGAVTSMMRDSGIDPEYGRRLPQRLAARGLLEIGGESDSHVVRGGSRHAEMVRLAYLQIGDRIAGRGISADEIASVLDLYADPRFVAMSPVVVVAWGRRPP